MGLRNLPTPDEKDPGGEFVVQKVVTIGGTRFLPGDILPIDNMIRTMPHKLNILCRMRTLSQVAARATPSVSAAVAPQYKKQPSTAILKALSRDVLIALAKDRGVSHEGDDKSLRISIRKSYE